MGLLEKTSESSQDALFGPLLIVSTTLNLGLNITAMAFELAATFLTEMSFLFEMVLPAPSDGERYLTSRVCNDCS
jgi:hypothetical protein